MNHIPILRFQLMSTRAVRREIERNGPIFITQGQNILFRILPGGGSVPKAQHPEKVDEEVMVLIRRVLDHGAMDETSFIQKLAEELGYMRAGPRLRPKIIAHIRVAVERGIISDGKFQVRRRINEVSNDVLKREFLLGIGDGWIERPDAIRACARRLGYVNAGPQIQAKLKRIIQGLLRDRKLKTDGNLIRRRNGPTAIA